MKTLKIMVIALASVGSASAALYTLQTGTGASINGFANSAGVAYQGTSGAMSFGYFTISDAAITATIPNSAGISTLVSSFVSFAGPGSFAVGGPIGQKGAVSVAGSGTVTGTNFDGKSIYAFVFNGSTLAAATDIGILKTTIAFAGSQDAIPTPLVYTFSTSDTLLKGSQIADLKTTTTDSTVNPGFGTVTVPEPSAALLGVIGALGLLRRRRN